MLKQNGDVINDMYKVDRVQQGGRVWHSAPGKCGPLAEGSAAKLKRGKLNMTS